MNTYFYFSSSFNLTFNLIFNSVVDFTKYYFFIKYLNGKLPYPYYTGQCIIVVCTYFGVIIAVYALGKTFYAPPI